MVMARKENFPFWRDYACRGYENWGLGKVMMSTKSHKIAIRGPFRYISQGVICCRLILLFALVAAIAVIAVHRVVSATIAQFL